MIVVRAGRSDSTAGRKWELGFLLIRLGLRMTGCCWLLVGGRDPVDGGDVGVVGEMKAISRRNMIVFSMMMFPLFLRVILEVGQTTRLSCLLAMNCLSVYVCM